MTDKQPALFDWATELSDAQGRVTLSAQEAKEIGARLRSMGEKLKVYEDLGDTADDMQLLRMGYAAAHMKIESLQARIKTMAKERADELIVAHLDGRMCGHSTEPAGAQQPAPPTAQAEGWTKLPGTLPKPGTPVLLDIGKQYPIRAMWAAKFTLPVSLEDDSGFGEHDERTDEWYCPEGWYEWNEHEEIHWRVTETPRAWAPLPPTTSAGSGNGE